MPKKNAVYFLILAGMILFSASVLHQRLAEKEKKTVSEKRVSSGAGFGVGRDEDSTFSASHDEGFFSGAPDKKKPGMNGERPFSADKQSQEKLSSSGVAPAKKSRATQSVARSSRQSGAQSGTQTEPMTGTVTKQETGRGDYSLQKPFDAGGIHLVKEEVVPSNPLPTDEEIEQSIQEQNEKNEQFEKAMADRDQEAAVVQMEIAKMNPEELMPPAPSTDPPPSADPSSKQMQQVQSGTYTVH